VNETSTQQVISRAESLYRALLFVYPPTFRRSFGQQMAQTFRDCCREELEQNKKLGLARLWASMLYDLTASACLEYAKSLLAMFRRLTGLEKEYLMSSLLSLDVASRTDIGLKRSLNEDNTTSIVPEDPQVMAKKGALFVVADGLGGHTKGDVASEMAVTLIRDAYYQDENDDILVSLRQAVERANEAIYRRNEALFPDKEEMTKKGMGTTCVAAVLKENMVYVANAGDSLVYIVRGGQVLQIAEDHSWFAEQVRKGEKITRAEAEAQGKGNIIVRCLGYSLDLEVYAGSEQVQNGDVLVLCTDGLHGQVSEDEIRTIVEQYGSEESATRLIARANENGGPDNITAVVVRVSLA
jgi:serine/threonine protein phosphatase PrpC